MAGVGLACIAVIVAAWSPHSRGPRWWRKAAMFGMAAAVAFAFTAALTKVVTDYIATDWVRCSATGRPTAWPSPACWPCS